MVTCLTELSAKPCLTGSTLLKMLLSEEDLRFAIDQGFGSGDLNFIRFSSSDKTATVAIAEDANQSLTALQIRQKDEKGHGLVSEYILNEKAHLLNIRTAAEFFEDEKRVFRNRQTASAGLLRRLIQEGYLEDDAGLPISPSPVRIAESDMDLIKHLTEPNSPFRLPIILLIPGILPCYKPDVLSLAAYLCGQAHVLVFQNRKAFLSFKQFLRQTFPPKGPFLVRFPFGKSFDRFPLTARQNPAAMLSSFLLRQQVEPSCGEEISFGRICEDILFQVSLSGKQVKQAHTNLPASLEQEKAKIKAEASDQALREAQDIVEVYEHDIEKLKNELYEKTLLAEGLKAESERLRSRLPQNRVPVLYLGKEREFYPGEIQDLLLASLEEVLKNCPGGCRRRDVIQDILDSNNYQHISKDRSDEVHRLLKSYNGMTAKIQRGLSDLGFSIVKAQNEHYKVLYHGYRRYMTVLAGSPSDVRSGQNNAALIIRLAF